MCKVLRDKAPSTPGAPYRTHRSPLAVTILDSEFFAINVLIIYFIIEKIPQIPFFPKVALIVGVFLEIVLDKAMFLMIWKVQFQLLYIGRYNIGT